MRSVHPRIINLLIATLLCSGCSVRQSESGTSEVLLIDYSKSFVPLNSTDGRALKELAEATADLARGEWKSPVSVVWSRIQNASLTSTAICRPPEFQPQLVKKADSGATENLGDFDTFEKALQTCATSAVEQSAISSEQAPYTDISGAVALAADQGRTVPGARYLVLISDFVEDMPPGKTPVGFRLSGEHVLLLHRPGAQRVPASLNEHMRTVEKWRRELLEAGASSVVTLPLVSVTRERIMRALTGTKHQPEPNSQKAGTDIVLLQNLPDTVSKNVLALFPEAFKLTARDWPSPVTVTWADMRPQPESFSQVMPPLEFVPQLIKGSDATEAHNFQNARVSTQDDFISLLNQYAAGMQRFSPGANKADIGGALNLYESAGYLDSEHIFIILSNFAGNPPTSDETPSDLQGTLVIMLPGANRADEADEGADYERRIDIWDQWFQKHHARVCRLPLIGLSANALSRVLTSKHSTAGCRNE